MRLLFVTTNCYPKTGTCTNLIERILFEGEMISKVESVMVLSGKSSFFDSASELYNGVNIVRVDTWSLYKRSEIKEVATRNILEAIVGLGVKAVKYLEERLCRSHFMDSCLERDFYRALMKIDKSKYDVIISISGRYEGTSAVLKFIKKYNKKAILYQVDPCLTNVSMPIESYSRRKLFEEKLWGQFSGTVTMPLLYGDLKQYLGFDELSKIAVADLPLVIKPKRVKHSEGKSIICMFLGSIYGGIRDPRYTLDLFKILLGENIELHLVGVEKNQLPTQFNDLEIKCYGRVDNQTAQRLMLEEADVLINIGNINRNQIPSKIFEYMSTGKPIVNVCKSRECTTIPYFSRYPLAINLYEEDEILEEQQKKLKDFVEYNAGEVLEFEEIEKRFSDCTPIHCANVFLEMLNRIEVENKEEISYESN